MHRKLIMNIGILIAIWFTIVWPCHLDRAWAQTQSTEKRLLPESSRISKADGEEPTGVLNLKQALSLALMKNPELAAFSWEIRAREAQALQAGLILNPEISVEAENFGGSGELRGFKNSETTLSLGQTIQLGGKRLKRRYAATLEKELARWDYEAKRADVLTDVTKSFMNVLAAQERLALTEELFRLSEEVSSTISARVKAGKVSPVEETRAGVALATARTELEKAKRELEGARKRLAAIWASPSPTFEKVEGNFSVLVPIPSTEQLTGLISQNPDVARWAVEMEQRRAALKRETANRIPDLNISLGVRRLNEIDKYGFVAGVSIPLPLFNRNQGGILEAARRLSKAEEERRSAQVRVLTTLSEAYQAVSSAYAEATILKNDALPGALSAFEAIREGYRQGKFGYLDVLDAQRTLFEVRRRYVDSLAAYHTSTAEVKRLIGDI